MYFPIPTKENLLRNILKYIIIDHPNTLESPIYRAFQREYRGKKM
jgi:hypothetical protein